MADNELDLLDEMLAEKERLNKEIEKLRAQQRKECIAQMRKDVKRLDITPQEVFGEKPSRSKKAARTKPARKKARAKVPPKYRDPATGNTWTGRGREPVWMQGKNREDYLIRD